MRQSDPQENAAALPVFRASGMTIFRATPAFLSLSVAARTVCLCLAASVMPPVASGQEITSFYIREYRVEGAKRLKNLEVEEAVYPYLGPERAPADVEQARLALEKIYHDKGFQTVSVVVPQQDPRYGVIRLEVVEGKVGRLRVHGARFFLPSRIKAQAPSVAEGTLPNLEDFKKDNVALNRNPDRRVTPSLRTGVEPGTYDIDLNVEDELPLHGSLELNNRNSADTTGLRLNGALSYGNLFQLGQTVGFNFQIAPQRLDDSAVYSAYYLARVSDSVSLMLTGTKQNSDVNTIGGAASAGRGEIVGLRAIFDLPAQAQFYQNFSFGIDYKNLSEDLIIGSTTSSSPIEYYPLSASYGATWMTKNGFTELNHSATLGLRGVGSNEIDYATRRFNASGSFIHLRSDLSHTHDLKDGSQVFGKIQGQVSTQPLINSEQFSGGGLGSARGYLESTSLGDNGVFGTVELRSPSLLGKSSGKSTGKSTGESTGEAAKAEEWRFHGFTDVGWVGIYDALPGQQSEFGFASVGFGTRFRVREHYNGSLDVAFPLIEKPHADEGDVRVTFRGWADF